MSFLDQIIERARERYDYLMHGQTRRMQVLTRVAFLALFALFVSTIIPTMAQDNPTVDPANPIASSSADPSTTPSDTTTDTPIAYSSPTVSGSPLGPLPTATPDSVTASPKPIPPHPLETQTAYSIHAPSLLNVDPRASIASLPAISATGAEYTLICVTGTGIRFDTLNKRVQDSLPSSTLELAGDLTNNLRISGPTQDAMGILNSMNGLTVFADSNGLPGKSLTVSFVAMSAPDTTPSFCGSARSGATVTFRALGLDMASKIGPIQLKK